MSRKTLYRKRKLLSSIEWSDTEDEGELSETSGNSASTLFDNVSPVHNSFSDGMSDQEMGNEEAEVNGQDGSRSVSDISDNEGTDSGTSSEDEFRHLPEDAFSDDENEDEFFDAHEDEFFDADEEVSEHDDEDEDFVLFGDRLVDGNQPIYEGAHITVAESILSIFTFATVHNLTGMCVADLLSLIRLHCLQSFKSIQSLYHFRKLFASLSSPLRSHFYCKKCERILTSKTDRCPDCPFGSNTSFFLTMSLKEQLQTMYGREGFIDKLRYPNERTKKVANNYEELYDGNLYKEQIDAGFLNGQNISFTWNSDGVPIFKSTKLSFWPLYLVINELPYRERYKIENLVLAAIWFGEKKPRLDIFFGALENDVRSLHEGEDFNVPRRVDPVKVRGVILCGTCDLPAKAIFLNMVQYNGWYSCCRCYVKGERSERTENRHSFPLGDYPVRKNEEFAEFADLAEERGEAVNGIKGQSVLTRLVPEAYRSTAVDVMHCAFLGVSKRLMLFWFDQEFYACPFSMRRSLDIASEYICNLTPPSFVQRMPRSISDHLHFWKASEFKSWLFYYSLPILSELMTPEFLNHHMLLVFGLYLVNQESISEEDIQTASVLLREYVSKFGALYGLKYLTLNVHLLLHLPECVRDFGPLWNVSCFSFENLNGELKKLVHGTRFTEMQICSKVNGRINLSRLINDLPDNSRGRLFCEKLQAKKRVATDETFGNNLSIVGKCTKQENFPPLVEDAIASSNLNGNISIFLSLKKGHIIYRAQSYKRSKKRVSHCVMFKEELQKSFGIVDSFLRVTQCDCSSVCKCAAEYFVVITAFDHELPFHIAYPPVPVSYIHLCKETDRVFVLPIECLECVCIMVLVNEKIYVTEPLNVVELE